MVVVGAGRIRFRSPAFLGEPRGADHRPGRGAGRSGGPPARVQAGPSMAAACVAGGLARGGRCRAPALSDHARNDLANPDGHRGRHGSHCAAALAWCTQACLGRRSEPGAGRRFRRRSLGLDPVPAEISNPAESRTFRRGHSSAGNENDSRRRGYPPGARCDRLCVRGIVDRSPEPPLDLGETHVDVFEWFPGWLLEYSRSSPRSDRSRAAIAVFSVRRRTIRRARLRLSRSGAGHAACASRVGNRINRRGCKYEADTQGLFTSQCVLRCRGARAPSAGTRVFALRGPAN